MGRFLNADSVGNLVADSDFPAFTLFAYCLNNPINLAAS
ncbi:MAG: hypothetical protein IJS22_09665 [Lachnospiraceae bacterium]|nr:hypothetical protein [Lachnospiraceae bacterium]